eukprot:4916036-Pyramimonas_sp.AAC.1
MGAYVHGHLRIDCLKELEKNTGEIPEETWRDVWGRGDVQAGWDLLRTLRQVYNMSFRLASTHQSSTNT